MDKPVLPDNSGRHFGRVDRELRKRQLVVAGGGGGGGATGATGAAGDPGGATGATGSAGSAGATGSAGTNGATGATGALGAGASIQWNEVPGGAVNGTNVDFTLAFTPDPAISLELYRNGLLLDAGVDYTLAGTAITMTEAPLTGDVLLATYQDSTNTISGATGAAGATGASGNGATGSTGPYGLDGAPGHTGATGAGGEGTVGGTGPTGPDGATGSTSSLFLFNITR